MDFNLKICARHLQQGDISTTLDQLVKDKVIPKPNHIKIDVDGFEHKILQGAKKTLESKDLKSVPLEINWNIDEHQKIIDHMDTKDFTFDPNQAETAKKKEGSFTGIGNCIFFRKSQVKN
ncbi:MAG: hypothetical protein ACI9S8_001489 [Chlamydiales bacterium]